MSRKKIKVDDMGGTSQKFKAKYDNEIVKLTAYNDHFTDTVEIPIGIFCEMALTIQNDYMHGLRSDD